MSEVEQLARLIKHAILFIAVAIVLVNLIRWIFKLGLCPTDAKDGRRSDLSLKIDHGTGLHYLQSRSGHLTPRLDKDGKQVRE